MSFGNTKKANKAAAKAAAYAAPKNFYSPSASLKIGEDYTEYNPYNFGNSQTQMQNSDQKLNQLTAGVPTSLSVDDFYHNPFYESTLSQMRRPIDYQYDIDRRNTARDLNARNLRGGSYSALQEDLLGRRYDQQYANAADQARQTSANAYQQSFTNQMAAMQGLRGDQLSNLQALYYPLQMANDTNRSIAAQQSAQAQPYSNLASVYASKKSPLQSLLDYSLGAASILMG